LLIENENENENEKTWQFGFREKNVFASVSLLRMHAETGVTKTCPTRPPVGTLEAVQSFFSESPAERHAMIWSCRQAALTGRTVRVRTHNTRIPTPQCSATNLYATTYALPYPARDCTIDQPTMITDVRHAPNVVQPAPTNCHS